MQCEYCPVPLERFRTLLLQTSLPHHRPRERMFPACLPACLPPSRINHHPSHSAKKDGIIDNLPVRCVVRFVTVASPGSSSNGFATRPFAAALPPLGPRRVPRCARKDCIADGHNLHCFDAPRSSSSSLPPFSATRFVSCRVVSCSQGPEYSTKTLPVQTK